MLNKDQRPPFTGGKPEVQPGNLTGTNEQDKVKLSIILSFLKFLPLSPDAPAVNIQAWLQCEKVPASVTLATNLEIDEDTVTRAMCYRSLPCVMTWQTPS